MGENYDKQNDPFRVLYRVDAFDGGLNSKYEPQLISDIESPDCLNVVFKTLGSVQTRDGNKLVNTAAVTAYACDGLFTTRFNNGTQTMVGWWAGTAYTLNGTSFITIPSAQSVFTAGTRVDAKMYQNIMFFGNGSSTYKYNGTEFTQHGIMVPSAPSVGTGAGGVLSGAYQYRCSYMNSYVVEGDVGIACATLSVAGGVQINVTGIPVGAQSFGVAQRKLYRTVTSGTTFQLVTTINDNTTTTYTDNTADGGLGAIAPTDQGKPVAYKYLASHQERLWMVIPNSSFLYYTEVGNPFVRKVSNFILISDGDNEVINAVNVHENNVVCYKDASVWVMFLPDATPGNWIRIKAAAKYGAVSHYSIADYQSMQMYLGKRYDQITGFYALTGINVKPDKNMLQISGVLSDSQADRIEPDIFGFSSNMVYLGLSCAIEFKNKLWFAVPYGNSATNNRVYQFDFQRRDIDRTRGSWVPFTGWNVGCWTILSGKLYYGSSTIDGFVYQCEAGVYNDNGAAINSYYWTREFDGYPEDSDVQKDWRWGSFIVENLGNYYMGITYRFDSDKGSGVTKEINLNAGGSNWGSMRWGIDSWGGGVTRQTAQVFLGGQSAKRVQFQFSNLNTANQGFKVIRSKLYYNRRGTR